MNWYYIVFSLVILFIIELKYFKIAKYFNIIDKPNHRSSHTNITIRGGGIIFVLALFLHALYAGLLYPYFLSGIFLIGFISFVDDINPVSNKIRMIFHLVAVTLAFVQVGLFTLSFYWVIIALIFVIGTINAINFMDGINGITGIYGLVTLGTLYYINWSVNFTQSTFLLSAILSIIVFNFFNFRAKAVCFAGDVGSISLAFSIIFFMLQLILHTQNLSYILLLLIYGLDTFTTIVFRAIKRENIFEAHRSHFYQFWANEKQISHLIVAASYGILQLIINIVFLNISIPLLVLPFVILTSILTFIVIRIYTEGTKRLLHFK